MLGKRLEQCIEMIEKGMVVCDVGADHGYLACEIVKRNISDLVIASDINEGPLLAAQKNVAAYGYEKKIPLMLSDGLEKISESPYANRINCIVIAGMGGKTIQYILENGFDLAKKSTLVLQPITRENVLRKWLLANGFFIKEEKIAEDGNKIYTVIKAVYTGKKKNISEARSIMGYADYSEDITKEYGTIQYNKYLRKYNGLQKACDNKDEYEKLEKMKENIIEAERILKGES